MHVHTYNKERRYTRCLRGNRKKVKPPEPTDSELLLCERKTGWIHRGNDLVHTILARQLSLGYNNNATTTY